MPSVVSHCRGWLEGGKTETQASVSVSRFLIRLIAISALFFHRNVLSSIFFPFFAALLFRSCKVAAFVFSIKNKAMTISRHYIIKRTNIKATGKNFFTKMPL